MIVNTKGLAAAILLALLAVVSVQAQSQPSFERTDYPTNLSPHWVVAADFNGDGIPDLATVNQDNTVSILLGTGAGNFGLPASFPTGANPLRLAVADFNRDGILDIATVNQSENTVSILLGNGDGSFKPKVDLPVGVLPESLVVGDFNRDGNIDIATANTGSDSISLLFGNGDGTFRGRVDIPAGPKPFSLTTGDFNHDGVADLALVNCCDNAGFLLSTITVLLGNGNGTFRPQAPLTQTGPIALVAGDVNSDHFDDLVATFRGCHTPCAGVTVYISNGDGTFQSSQPTLINDLQYGLPRSPVVGDFNGDGIADIAFTNTKTKDQFGGGPTDWVVSVLLGKGGGTVFAAPFDFIVGDGAQALISSDLNKDGRLDLASANGLMTSTVNPPRPAGNSVSVLLNSTGGPLPQSDFTLAATPSSRIVNRGQSAGYSISVSPLGGGFTAAVTLACSGLPAGAACTFSPSSVTPGGIAASSALTISTTAPSAFMGPARPLQHSGVPFYALWLPFAIGFVGFTTPSSQRHKMTLAVVLALVALIGSVNCGGGSHASSPTASPLSSGGSTSGTPVGTYTVTVTGTSGSVQHSTAVSLLVQ